MELDEKFQQMSHEHIYIYIWDIDSSPKFI